MNSSSTKTYIAVAIIAFAVAFSVFVHATEPSYIHVPAILCVVACSGALILWDFFGFNRRIFLFFVLLAALYASVPLLRLCIGSELYASEFLVAIEAACASFVPLLFLWYLSGQARNHIVRGVARVLAALVAIALILFPGLICGYFIAMRQLLTSDIILAMAQTNGDESFEYVEAHGNIWWIAAFVFTLLLVAFYLLLLAKAGVNRAMHFRGRIILGVFLLVVSIADLVRVLPHVPYYAFSMIDVSREKINEFKLYSNGVAERQKMLASLPPISADRAHAGVYVLVLGESENRDHMQCYGYGRETTPYMEELLQDPDTVLFEKPYSSFPQTVPALTYALSGKNQYNGASLTDSFSIIEIARRAGFDVWWISNQRKFGVFDTPISVLSSTASNEIWLNSTANKFGPSYDGDIANRIPSLKPGNNALVVIHLMGSHESYNERTPDGAKVFHGSPDQRTDWYDDTILYTDGNLKRICEKFEALPDFRALVYMSDHGEDVTEQFDHNPVKFTFQMVRVPLMVKLSESYSRDNPQTLKALKANSSRVWTNDLLFELMCGLMGLTEVPQYEQGFDISSSQYSLDECKALTMHGGKHVIEDPGYPGAGTD